MSFMPIEPIIKHAKSLNARYVIQILSYFILLDDGSEISCTYNKNGLWTYKEPQHSFGNDTLEKNLNTTYNPFKATRH